MTRRCLACITVALTACSHLLPPTTTPEPAASTPQPAQPASMAATTPKGPPVARTVPVVETHFGIELADPYRWMEGEQNDEYAQWLRAQDAYTREQLARMPGRERFFQRIRELGLSSTVSHGVQLAGGSAFFERTSAGEQLPKLMVRDEKGERVLVDPAQLAKDGAHASINNFSPSPDGKLLVYNVSFGGGEISALRVLDVVTGQHLPDVIERVWGEFAAAWVPDSKSFFYTQMALPAPGVDPMLYMQARLHVLGAPAGSDRPMLGGKLPGSLPLDASEFPFVYVAPGSSWAIAYAGGAHSEIRVAIAPLAKLDREGTGKTPWRSVAEYSDQVEAALPRGDRLYLLTFKNASNRKLISVPLNQPDLARARVEIAERADARLVNFAIARDAAYLLLMQSGRARLSRWPFRDKAQPVALPFEGWIDTLASDPQRDGAMIDIQGWTRPSAFYAIDKQGKLRETGVSTVTAADYAGIIAEEVVAKSSDGTEVPLSIVRKSDLAADGSHPALLYAYGAYGASQTPSFESSRQAWLERGGVFAVCHVRGGGENGYTWQLDGSRDKKLNGVHDLEACGEYLIEHGLTSASRLVARGGSMGGLLVGRAITERPDLFAAANIAVGVLNPVRILSAINGANQKTELGDPESEAGFKSILAMDPYHHVEPQRAYPAVLFTVGLNDNRVAPWMTGKMAAKLQAASNSDAPVLIRTDGDAGHGIGSARDQIFAERADVWSFFLAATGDPDFRPPPPSAASGADAALPLPGPDELIVGSERGLEAWKRDGSAQRRISLGPALHPRWLDSDSVVTLKPAQSEEQHDLRSGGRLERISLRDGSRTTLAQLPGFQCESASGSGDERPDPGTLDIQDPGDFEIADDKRAACIVLMDHNLNMANVRLHVRVDLKSAAITRWLDGGEPSCKAPAGVSTDAIPEGAFCDTPYAAEEAAEPKASDFPFVFEYEKLWQESAGGKRALKLQLPRYDVELTSPSGRWVLLSGDLQEADYVYRRLLLLDRESGQIYPIPSEPGAWPAPLGPVHAGALPAVSNQTVQIWGEVDVRWLGDSADSELLVIGALVVRPGRLRFLVDGEIVR